uniref:DNA-directed RNA polymerase n=1 Tax=Rhodochaete parvula TaxID=110510 RepID=A0A220T0H4_9RHOD|nr:DNA-directed RNA polymerase alpha subunit [Rhodochaete parvula]
MAQFQIECVDSKNEGLREQYGKFIIEPFKQGQGTTIGNALRRTILGDLKGTGITAVRISGINHEFIVISDIEEKRTGKTKVQGPAILTAGMFDLPPDITAVDPRQYIATICNNIVFEMEFQIEKSYGYRLVEKGIQDTCLTIDFLQVDSIFMPAKKVNITVENSKILSADTIEESLTLEVWTNGSMSPQETITQAAIILTSLFNPLTHLNFNIISENNEQEEKKISQVLIEELQLSVRAYNCLKRAQIHSVASQEELLEIKNFGQKSAEEVIEALQKRLGISLPKEKASKATK